ncbi:MAG: D-sedoheptulose 7-phosphate isomerase [Bacteroidota bacterium]|nr:D-sedoheptulose 7-phosphate isomerase [Bacteroidota bacterium]
MTIFATSMTIEPTNIMEAIARQHLRESIETKQRLLLTAISAIVRTGDRIADALSRGGKVLLCGNGGSAADAQHIAAELVIRYRSQVVRPALPAIALTVDPSLMTAGGNDIGFDNVFARAVEALGVKGDVLIGISTSGKSENVRRAIEVAKGKGIVCIGLLGGDGGPIAPLCDDVVIVPSSITAHIQECHITVGHIWCSIIEARLYPDLVSQAGLTVKESEL